MWWDCLFKLPCRFVFGYTVIGCVTPNEGSGARQDLTTEVKKKYKTTIGKKAIGAINAGHSAP